MKDIDDLDLKAEIDQISQKIDSIVETFEKLDPKDPQTDDAAEADGDGEEPDQEQNQ